ncbi:MAG: DUF3592 domain-containing protein [Chloroflexus sp.]|nr:DUF3592 domain-containing protein [Chloroflexus sp.]
MERFHNPLSALLGIPIMLVIGVALWWVGGYLRADTERRIATMMPTTGTIVALNARASSTSNGSSTLFYPVVEFRTASGETVRFESNTGSNPSPYQVGAQVDVLYDPKAPQSAFINSWWELWLPATIFQGFGGFFILLAVLAIFDLVLKALQIGGLLALLGAILWRRRGA